VSLLLWCKSNMIQSAHPTNLWDFWRFLFRQLVNVCICKEESGGVSPPAYGECITSTLNLVSMMYGIKLSFAMQESYLNFTILRGFSIIGNMWMVKMHHVPLAQNLLQ